MTTIKVKTRTGQITEMQVSELMEIEGKPYRPESDIDAIRDAVIQLEGRLDTLENILAGRELSHG